MPLVIETTVYTFSELPDDAKPAARNWFRETVGEFDWYGFIYDDFEAVCRVLGIELATRPVRLWGGGSRGRPCIWFSGFGSQGDGACFEGRYRYEGGAVKAIQAHAPEDTVLHDIAARLYAIQRRNFFQLHADIAHRGRHYHSGCMSVSVDRDSPTSQVMTADAEDALTQCLRDLADWLYRQLEREWDWMMSDEYADEGLIANGYTFTETGRRFG